MARRNISVVKWKARSSGHRAAISVSVYDPVFSARWIRENLRRNDGGRKSIGWKPGDASALSHRARAFKLFAEKGTQRGIGSGRMNKLFPPLRAKNAASTYPVMHADGKPPLAFVCTGRSVWPNALIAISTAMSATSRWIRRAMARLSGARWKPCVSAQARAPSPAFSWAAARHR